MLSDSEADYDAFDSPSERADKRLFSPNFWVRRIYPIYMLLMLFIFVFYMPYRVAFHPRERYGTSPGFCGVLEAEMFFTADGFRVTSGHPFFVGWCLAP